MESLPPLDAYLSRASFDFFQCLTDIRVLCSVNSDFKENKKSYFFELCFDVVHLRACIFERRSPVKLKTTPFCSSAEQSVCPILDCSLYFSGFMDLVCSLNPSVKVWNWFNPEFNT